MNTTLVADRATPKSTRDGEPSSTGPEALPLVSFPKPTLLKATFSKRTPSSIARSDVSAARTRIDVQLATMNGNELAFVELLLIGLRKVQRR